MASVKSFFNDTLIKSEPNHLLFNAIFQKFGVALVQFNPL